jgi:hypothetical protein
MSRIKKAEREAIVEAWKQGASILELSLQFHHYERTIGDVLPRPSAEEREAIFQEWLDGEWLEGLARKYRHSRQTTEEVVTDEAKRWRDNARIWEQNLHACVEERNDLEKHTCAREYVRRKMLDGDEAADQWLRERDEGATALNAKAKRLPGVPRFIFDDKGLLVDVVPFKPEPQPASENG